MEEDTKPLEAKIYHGFAVVYCDNGDWYNITYNTNSIKKIKECIINDCNSSHIFMMYKENHINGVNINLN